MAARPRLGLITTRSWLGPGPPADGEADGPSEVVALGFVDLVGSTAWAQTMHLRDQSLALTRFESRSRAFVVEPCRRQGPSTLPTLK